MIYYIYLYENGEVCVCSNDGIYFFTLFLSFFWQMTPIRMCHITSIIWFGHPTGLSARKFVIKNRMVLFKSPQIFRWLMKAWCVYTAQHVLVQILLEKTIHR